MTAMDDLTNTMDLGKFNLEMPKQLKYEESQAYMEGIKKSRQQLRLREEKRAREEADFKMRQEEDGEGEDEEQEQAAKKAKFEASKAELHEKRAAQAGPPVFRQALFPVQESMVEELDLGPEDALAARCSELLGDGSGFVDGATMARELLLGDWLYHHYTRTAPLPEALQESLFRLAVLSPEVEVARKAHQLLETVLRASLKPPQRSAGLYPCHPCQSSPCVISDQSFTAALAGLGVRLEGCTTAKGQGGRGVTSPHSASKEAANPSQGTPGWKETDARPNLNSLQLLLRLLGTVCELQVAEACSSLKGAGIFQLLLLILSLRLDPVASLLSADLEAVVPGLLDAMPDAEWTRKFSDLASQVAGLGGSHRGGVEVVRLLSGMDGRAAVLASHAAVHLLSSMLVYKDAKPGKVAKLRGEPQAADPEAAISQLMWYSDGFMRLAKNLKEGHVSMWEARSCVELADILLWPIMRENRGGSGEARLEDFIDRWHIFCGKLSSHMNKDTEGAALKLLITTIQTRNNAGSN